MVMMGETERDRCLLRMAVMTETERDIHKRAWQHVLHGTLRSQASLAMYKDWWDTYFNSEEDLT